MAKQANNVAQFQSRIQPQDNGCHLWTGAKTIKGYGRFPLKGKRLKAHRVAWEIAFGPIPADLCVLYRCDNPPCVNPEHLFLGTNADNTADMLSKGRYKSKLTPDQVAIIRTLTSETGLALARRFGVTQSTITLIRKGKNWRR